MKPAPERRNEIQWLRALAAFEVVVCHSDLIVKHFSPHRIIEEPWYNALAGVGVELFFLVSGYIMCMRVPATKGYRAFLTSRITRIYPLYWLFTTLVVLVATAVPAWRLGFSPDVATIARSYLILPGWGFPILGPGWTLEYEMVFYLLVTLLMACGVTRGPGMVGFAWLLAGLGLVGCLRGPAEEGSALLFHLLSPYMFAFGAGWLLRCLEGAARPAKLRAVALFAALAALAFWAGPDWAQHRLMRIGFAALVFTAVLLARRAFQAETRLNRAMWLVGDASYSLYLSHWFVLSAAGKMLGALGIPSELDWPVRVLGWGLCVAVGIAFYRWLEQPMERWLRRGRNRRPVMARPPRLPVPAPR